MKEVKVNNTVFDVYAVKDPEKGLQIAAQLFRSFQDESVRRDWQLEVISRFEYPDTDQLCAVGAIVTGVGTYEWFAERRGRYDASDVPTKGSRVAHVDVYPLPDEGEFDIPPWEIEVHVADEKSPPWGGKEAVYAKHLPTGEFGFGNASSVERNEIYARAALRARVYAREHNIEIR